MRRERATRGDQYRQRTIRLLEADGPARAPGKLFGQPRQTRAFGELVGDYSRPQMDALHQGGLKIKTVIAIYCP